MLKAVFDKDELVKITGFDIVKFFSELSDTSLQRLSQRMIQAQLINYGMLRKVGELMEDGISKIRDALTSGQKEKFLDAANAKSAEADTKWTYTVLYVLTNNLIKFVEGDKEASKLIPELIEVKKIQLRYWQSFFKKVDFAQYVELIEEKGLTNEIFYGIPLKISAFALVNQDLALRTSIVSEEVSKTHYELLVEELRYVKDKVNPPLEVKAQAHIAEMFLTKMWNESDEFKNMTAGETLNYLLNCDNSITDWVTNYVNPLEVAMLVKALKSFTRLKPKIEKSMHFILSNLVVDYVTKKVKVKEMENVDRQRAKEASQKINKQLYITHFAFDGKLKD